VARRIPEAHVVIGIAEGFGSSIPQPGHVHHEGMRLIRIGEMNGGLTDRVQRIERAGPMLASTSRPLRTWIS